MTTKLKTRNISRINKVTRERAFLSESGLWVSRSSGKALKTFTTTEAADACDNGADKETFWYMPIFIG